ncbi:MAG: MFS transporter [Candidatus Azotimanducaceae bacterium WSBS_2022_MAG_OTU7]
MRPDAARQLTPCAGRPLSSKERATALGIHALGIPIGIMFGMFAGGAIADEFGWRMAFLSSVFRALAVVVFMTVKEPPRGHADGHAELDSSQKPNDYGGSSVPGNPAFLFALPPRRFNGLCWIRSGDMGTDLFCPQL